MWEHAYNATSDFAQELEFKIHYKSVEVSLKFYKEYKLNPFK